MPPLLTTRSQALALMTYKCSIVNVPYAVQRALKLTRSIL